MRTHDPEKRLALLQEIEHRSLTTLREKLVKIGANVVRHGRNVTFQLAEVAVPRVSSGTAAAIYHLSGRQRKSKVAPQNSRYVP